MGVRRPIRIPRHSPLYRITIIGLFIGSQRAFQLYTRVRFNEPIPHKYYYNQPHYCVIEWFVPSEHPLYSLLKNRNSGLMSRSNKILYYTHAYLLHKSKLRQQVNCMVSAAQPPNKLNINLHNKQPAKLTIVALMMNT